MLIEGEAGNVTMVARGNTSDLTLESASHDVIVQAGEDVSLTATTGVISLTSTASEVVMTAATDATVTASNGILELTSTLGVVDINGVGGVTMTASAENATMLVEATDGGVEVVARGAARDLTLSSTLANVLVGAGEDVDITAGARMDMIVGTAATVTSSGTVDINASTALTMQATGEGSTVLIEGEAGNVTMVA
eukprot:SAG25_NODE_5569_length_643_cov_1.404412_1_plen_194_part_10